MATSHHNKVKLKAAEIHSVEYIDKSLVITEGQPSAASPTISHSDKTWTIDLYCGRKASKPVAGQFVNISGGVGHLYSPQSISDDLPEDLNFYFGVRVGVKRHSVIDYVTLYLGQGSRLTNNNWWIGGQCVALKQKAIVVIPAATDDGSTQVFTINDIDSGFDRFVLDAWFT